MYNTFHIKSIYTLVNIKELGSKSPQVKNMSEIEIKEKENKEKIDKEFLKEGEEHVNFILEEIKKYYEKENWEEFLNNAIDYFLIVSPDKKEIVGFDILINYGAPFTQLLYNRGEGEIIYKYANVEIKKEIDKEICDSILNFLEELTP